MTAIYSHERLWQQKVRLLIDHMRQATTNSAGAILFAAIKLLTTTFVDFKMHNYALHYHKMHKLPYRTHTLSYRMHILYFKTHTLYHNEHTHTLHIETLFFLFIRFFAWMIKCNTVTMIWIFLLLFTAVSATHLFGWYCWNNKTYKQIYMENLSIASGLSYNN